MYTESFCPVFLWDQACKKKASLALWIGENIQELRFPSKHLLVQEEFGRFNHFVGTPFLKILTCLYDLFPRDTHR